MSEPTMMSVMRKYNQAVAKYRDLQKQQTDAQRVAVDLVGPVQQAEAEVNKARAELLKKVEANGTK